MQQIILFFIKNSYRLLFLLLIGISFSLILKSHSFHRSQYINSANAVSGSVYETVNEANQYLSLKEKNLQLANENARLKELLFNKPDTLIKKTSEFENHKEQFSVIKAKVIKNEFNTLENYLTLNIGTSDSIKPDMGVFNDLGIVGIVEKTSKNYATVQSVLNIKSKINAKIKNSNHFGTLIWDGENVGYAQLIDVPRLAELRKGDSIVTGADSEIFPENLPIGKIDKVYLNTKTNYYTINVRLFSDMTSLGYVYIVNNKLKKEKQNLENEAENH
ncbi:rod shape-determining protein MreC [Flavobacterium sp.]|uniref:rod shape-determining protein MreC n=1 Tax=Flavobacterium sp. TaxID=239 RepID=UPI003528A3EF